MTGKKKMVIAAAAALIAAAGVIHAATVTIDPLKKYQTIEGFGGFGPKQQWWLGGPFYDNQHLSLIIDTLGATMLREQAYFDFEPANDNTDPFSARSAGFIANSAFLSKQLPFWRAVKAKADASGEPLNIIWTVWTPPAWMKTNNSTTNGGTLRNTMHNEYAEYCSEYMKMVHTECGFWPYMFSVQNEPRFVEPYESCVYTKDTLAMVAGVVGKRFETDGIPTRLYYGEDMLSSVVSHGVPDAGSRDTVARKYIHSWAVHGYSDGITPIPRSAAAGLWKSAARGADFYKVPLWMTETEDHDNTWTGGMLLANNIFAALKYGHVSAWVYFYLSGAAGTDFGFIQNGVPNRRFDAARHFYRNIRPGAVMVDANSSDTAELMSLAFTHSQKQTMTIVLINFGTAAKTVDLAGAGLPASFTMVRSSATDRYVRAGQTGPTGIAMPGSSVITLTAPFTPVSTVPHGIAPNRHGSIAGLASKAFYTLDGRRTMGASVNRGVVINHDGTPVFARRHYDR